MSFGRPSNTVLSVGGAPPERGSFPLDHGGECKQAMMTYIKCMKASKNDSSQCRDESKAYLACRMDKGLMERVPWTDLGFPEEEQDKPKP